MRQAKAYLPDADPAKECLGSENRTLQFLKSKLLVLPFCIARSKTTGASSLQPKTEESTEKAAQPVGRGLFCTLVAKQLNEL